MLSKGQVTPEEMYTTGCIAHHERKKPELSHAARENAVGMESLLVRGIGMPRANKSGTGRKGHRWVAQVKTDSTHPPAGLFTKDPATIARVLVSRKVSPKGPGSGMRMLTYFINRAGKGLSKARRAKLERAKELLAKRSPSQRRKRHAKAAGGR
jgi:tRNA(adenine34) deaminase